MYQGKEKKMKKVLRLVAFTLVTIMLLSAISGCSPSRKNVEIKAAAGVNKTTVPSGEEKTLGDVKKTGCELTIDGNTFTGDAVIEIVSASDVLPKEALDGSKVELVISPVQINCEGYDGSIFGTDVKLTLPMPEGVQPEECLFGYYDEKAKEVRYFFPDSYDLKNGTVTLNLPHFSLWWSSKPTQEQQIDAFLESHCMKMAIDGSKKKQAAAELEPYVRAKVEALGLTKQATADLTQSVVNFLGSKFTGDSAPYIEMGTKYVTTLTKGYFDGDSEAAKNGLNDAITDAIMNGWDSLEFSDRLDDVLGSEFAGASAKTLLSSSSGIARMAGNIAGGDVKEAMKELGDLMKGVHPTVEIATNAVALLGSLVNTGFTYWKSNQIEELYQIYKNGAEDIWGNEVIAQNRESFLTYLNTSSGFTMAKGVNRFYKLDKIGEICKQYGWPYSTYEELPDRFKEEFERRAEAGLMEYFETRVSQEKTAADLKKQEKAIVETMLTSINGALASNNPDARKFFGEASVDDYNVTNRLERLVNVRNFVSQYVDEDKLGKSKDDYNYGDVINWWVGYAANNDKKTAVELLMDDLEEHDLLKSGMRPKAAGGLAFRSVLPGKSYSVLENGTLAVTDINKNTYEHPCSFSVDFDKQVKDKLKSALGNIKIDSNGDFSVNKGGIVFSGHIDTKTLTGSGTYSFDFSGSVNVRTLQEYEEICRNDMTNFNWRDEIVLDGDYTWKEEGVFTFVSLPDKDGEGVIRCELTGTSNISVSGARIASLSNVDFLGSSSDLSASASPYTISKTRSDQTTKLSFTISE